MLDLQGLKQEPVYRDSMSFAIKCSSDTVDMTDIMETVYENGKLVVSHTFNDIRDQQRTNHE